MLSNYLSAAWRSLLRDRLYAIINVVGLAIGLSAALINHLPTIKPIARLHIDTVNVVRIGQVETLQHMHWADPAFFQIFRFPTLAGDLVHALDRPDGLVLTRSTARSLYGRDNVVGETLELDHAHTLRVAAVIEDLPGNTHLDIALMGSGLAVFSPLAKMDAAGPGAQQPWDTSTYFLLHTGLTLESVRAALSANISELRARPGKHNGMQMFFPVEPIDDIHLSPPGGMSVMKSRGSVDMMYAIGGIGLLILGVSIINFINLSTARGSRRRVEVGIRKALGATRGQLIIQFMGEAIVYAALGAILALCLIELLVPLFNRLSGAGLTFDYWEQPLWLLCVLVLTILAGLLAGVYPALVLSSLNPLTALKGGPLLSGGGIRTTLVTAQFAVLIGLLCTIIVLFEQTSFARKAAGRLDTNNVFVIMTECGSFNADLVSAVPGVISAGCSEGAPMGIVKRNTYGNVRAGIRVPYRKEIVAPGFFEVYGVKPTAGRLFLADRAADADAVVINTTAVRRFGFTSAPEAVGQLVAVHDDDRRSQIIGVIPDFHLESVRNPIEATVFNSDNTASHILSFRTRPQDQEHTLEQVRALWKKLQPSRPVDLFPADQALRKFYVQLIAQGAVFSACSAIALLLAATGLFGLASFAAERRAKETGIRKAMGAGRADILRLLMGPLTLPVLEANLVAWPVCYFILHRWLSGFAYHVDLGAEVFLGAGAIAVLIAWATILAHALRLAALKPVTSLRHE